MLGKLFKYEFKKQLPTTGKALVIITLSVLGANLLMWALSNSLFAENSGAFDRFCDILTFLISIAAYFLLVALAPITGSASYNQNISADTAYLMNTLPTKSSERVLSCFFANLVWWIISIAAGALAGLTALKSEFLSVRELIEKIAQKASDNPKLFISMMSVCIGFIVFMTMGNIMINTLVMRYIGKKNTASNVAGGIYLLFIGTVVGEVILLLYLEMKVWVILLSVSALFLLLAFVSYIISKHTVEYSINIA